MRWIGAKLMLSSFLLPAEIARLSVGTTGRNSHPWVILECLVLSMMSSGLVNFPPSMLLALIKAKVYTLLAMPICSATFLSGTAFRLQLSSWETILSQLTRNKEGPLWLNTGFLKWRKITRFGRDWDPLKIFFKATLTRTLIAVSLGFFWRQRSKGKMRFTNT